MTKKIQHYIVLFIFTIKLMFLDPNDYFKLDTSIKEAFNNPSNIHILIICLYAFTGWYVATKY